MEKALRSLDGTLRHVIAIFACLKLCARRIKGLKFFLVLLGSKLSAMKLTCDIHTAQKFHNIYKKFSWFFARNVDINVEINISKEICFIKVVWSKFCKFDSLWYTDLKKFPFNCYQLWDI